jgi:protein-disulfide isomerase
MPDKRHGLALAALVIVVACGPSPEDVSQLSQQQKEILAKLGEVDKKLDQLAKAPPAAARPQQAEADRVYDLPVGASPLRGAADAKVAIVEFSDFQ